MAQVQFFLKEKDGKIIGRLTETDGMNLDHFKQEYKNKLLLAQSQRQKRLVLFDLRVGYSLTLFFQVKDQLVHFFNIEIKHLSEAVIEKCIVVIPNAKISSLIQCIIDSIGTPIPTSVVHDMPHK